jgi:hypothetical protein
MLYNDYNRATESNRWAQLGGYRDIRYDNMLLSYNLKGF